MKYIVHFSICLALICCHNNRERLTTDALKLAETNRSELETLLSHYQNNKQKQQAAKFLIQNMYGKYFMNGNKISKYHAFIDSIYQIEQIEYDEDLIYENYLKRPESRQELSQNFADLQTLKADYLIQQIDEAFKVWEKPWNKHLSFDDFCEWILPYRIGNEIPENWRPLYQAQFSKLLNDTVINAKEACTIINNKLINLPIHVFHTSIQPSNIRPSSLINIKFGLCEDYAALAVFSMRAVGIPVAIEFVPHWGRNNKNHTFNVVYNNDGKYYDFSGGEQNPGEHLHRFEGIPKIYRKTFGYQKTSLAMMRGNEDIPNFFKNPCIKDVTDNYGFICSKNISISIPRNKTKNNFGYLCVFDPAGWVAIDWGRIENGEINFKNIGPDIIYQIAYYDKKKLMPLTVPFFVDSCGKINNLNCSENKISLHLERKFRPASGLKEIPNYIVGGKFQASNFKDFKKAEDLYTFTTPPNFKYTTINTNPSKKYKYYRYLSSDETRGNMAEIEFYDKQTSQKANGEIIGTEITSIYFPNATKKNLFDGDALTFFHTRDTLSWAGLELDEPAIINKIRYIIRNDDNGIRKNNLYELFYIDENKQWTSAGRKIATEDDMIIFDNIPAGTLYWLRNHTRGQEERIFTYENGKQIWW